jgi:hypothetical protein
VKLKNGTKYVFCEHCFIKFNANMKCDYCYQVYYDAAEDAQMDGKDWIECTGCEKWNHTDCEIKLGTDKGMREVALEQNEQAARKDADGEAQADSEHKDKPYWCLKCRRAKAAKEKAEQQKKLQKPKPAPVQERVSTRQLARVAK